jgi:replicative DNA helicase
LPPHEIDAEQAVLGACLIDRETIISLSTRLEPSDFYRAAHQAIWAAMVALFERRVPIDLLLLAAELRDRGTLGDAGGEAYLAELIAATPTAVHAGYYAGRVREAAVRRRLLTAARAIGEAAMDRGLSIEEVTARSTEALTEAAMARMGTEYRAMAEIAERVFDALGQPAVRPIETGIYPLDRIIGGLRRGELTIVAARPSVGKTALAVQIANAVSLRGTPVGFLSLEMHEAGLASRFLALNSGVDMYAYQLAGGNEAETSAVMRAFAQLAERPLYISDAPDMSLSSVVGRARRMHAERGIAVLIVDYLQLVTVPSGQGRRRPENRVQEMTLVSGEMKRLARELDVAVLALAQLSRAVERRTPPRPILSDLRESGSLEQDGDVIVFIHRPDQYDTSAEAGMAELIVAKHRNGPTGVGRMRFRARTAEFVSCDMWDGVE